MSAALGREIGFQLNRVLDLPGLLRREHFAHLNEGVIGSVLDTAARIAEDHFAPCNRLLDENQPVLQEGRVHLPDEVSAACRAFVDAGLMRAHLPEADGGLQLPWSVSTAAMTYFQAANISATAYLTLTMGAANLLHKYGSEDQKRTWMEPLFDGRFFGTMALSEPQAGSSLADIRTLATPRDDGSYAITGTKQWISAGEHELAENIVHLMLAKTPGAPAGVRGISLFVVPRYRLDGDGRPGEENDVRLVSLLHKMGYRGTVSSILALGGDARCRGWLVGREGQGLACMFNMMNEARIGVGMGAAALAWAGFRYSLDYARTRRQGRKPGAKDPGQPMIAIVDHADVRHMLLRQKVYAEGALALGLYCAGLLDEQVVAEDAETRTELGLLLDLLTPIAKAWSSDYGIEANMLAIQILGGYGYTVDYPVEQYLRDNRLNPIHEGTNGIQAIDLLGRKVVQADGRALRSLEGRVRVTIDAAKAHEALADCARALDAAVERLVATTRHLLQGSAQRGAEAGLAHATTYLHQFGHTVVAWLWLQQGLAAQRALQEDAGSAQAGWYRGKIDACRYFHRWELPRTRCWAELLQQDDMLVLETRPDDF